MTKLAIPPHAVNQPGERTYMQTRRKSLSLTALGIHVPGKHAPRSSNRPHPGNTTTTADSPPAKRVKRSHTLSSTSSASSPLCPHGPRHASTPTHRAAEVGPAFVQTMQTPPQSPGEYQQTKLDTEGINDDVVVAVLQQLESTGNRPHLIKELATVLVNSVLTVESSSNPTAIVSSRLTNYLKRPWTALAPCPLAKEQVMTHPRRVYYFLTTCHRQDIPEFSHIPMSKRIISPSLSSGPDEEEEESELRFRDVHSPSPELELSIPDMEFNHSLSMAVPPFVDSTTSTSFANTSHNRRAASPPLEHDEREFTHTASVMQQRKQSEQIEQEQLQLSAAGTPTAEPDVMEAVQDETEESAALRNREAAAALFGHGNNLLQVSDFSSPVLRPMTRNLHLTTTTPKRPFGFAGDVAMFDRVESWAELKSPECVELAELDDLLGGF